MLDSKNAGTIKIEIWLLGKIAPPRPIQGKGVKEKPKCRYNTLLQSHLKGEIEGK